jgi:phospholipid transport system substrate-binding protein
MPHTTIPWTSDPQHESRLPVQFWALLAITLYCPWFATLAGAVDPMSPAESAPTEAVKSTVNQLMQVLEDEQLKRPDLAEQRRHEIERVVMLRVSYEEMAKRALGTPWSDISEQDRQEFVGLFVQLLRDSFAGRINQRTDEQVVYLGEQREDRFAEVRTQLTGLKVDTRVDFRLMRVAEDWLVYDVVIDGASVVSNYRAQFTSIIRDVAYVGLVKKMRQKAVAVKFFEQGASP